MEMHYTYTISIAVSVNDLADTGDGEKDGGELWTHTHPHEETTRFHWEHLTAHASPFFCDPRDDMLMLEQADNGSDYCGVIRREAHRQFEAHGVADGKVSYTMTKNVPDTIKHGVDRVHLTGTSVVIATSEKSLKPHYPLRGHHDQDRRVLESQSSESQSSESQSSESQSSEDSDVMQCPHCHKVIATRPEIMDRDAWARRMFYRDVCYACEKKAAAADIPAEQETQREFTLVPLSSFQRRRELSPDSPDSDDVKGNRNAKGNRKVVVTTYPSPKGVFKIPDGLDLEDKSVVTSWETKGGCLYIYYVDGREEEIEWKFDPADDDVERYYLARAGISVIMTEGFLHLLQHYPDSEGTTIHYPDSDDDAAAAEPSPAI